MDRGNNEITDVDSGNIRTYDSPNTKTAAAVSIGSSNDASSIAATSTSVIADMDVASADCASADPVPQGRIRKIDAKSVQRIVAGQAVTDLASAVKELVDNSLDAASQSINIRLFNKGMDIVEVTDDGIGVPIESRQYLATPHATSKIRTFEDIYHCAEDSDDEDEDDDDDDNNDDSDDDEPPSSALTTMGFRGEALFCLANISANLMVSTRTASEDLAEKMEFQKDGSLNTEAGIEYMPRKVGTTVAIIRLFDSLPVRRKDMIRRLKQQRSRLVQMMEQYAIFSTGVRFNVMDMIANSTTGQMDSKSLLATTSNNRNLQETVSSILGSKFLSNMCPIDICLTSIVCNSADTNDDDHNQAGCDESDRRQRKRKKSKYRFHGLISKAGGPSSGRGAGCRHVQYFSINRRPVDVPKVARLINDTWRSVMGTLNQSSSASVPSCILQFTLPNNSFDVNLSPDKRQVILTNEVEIYETIQEGLVRLWKSQTDGQFRVNHDSVIANPRVGSGLFSSRITDDDENNNADDDNQKVCSLFKTIENDDRNNADEDEEGLDDDEFIASRRYGFAEDPTLAASRELEHRKRREEYMALKRQRQQQQGELQNVKEQLTMSPFGSERDSEQMESHERMTHSAPSDDRKAVTEGLITRGIKKVITPSPTHLHQSNISKYIETKDININSGNSSSMNCVNETLEESPRREDLQPSLSEKKRWQEVSTVFNSSSSNSMDDPMNGPIQQLLLTTSTDQRCNGDFVELEGREQRPTMSSQDRGGSVSSSHSRKRKTLDLEQFGFKVFNKGPIAVTESESSFNKNAHSSNQREDIGEHEASNDKVRAKARTIPSSTLPSSTRSYVNARNRVAAFENCLRNLGPISEIAERDSVPPVESTIEVPSPPKTTVWKSITSTEDVVAASIRERIAMRERRMQLRSTPVIELQPGSIESDVAGIGCNGPVLTDVKDKEGSLSLTKYDFKSMKIIGQFNLGFMLATTSDGNLWILDQHACDEKYNFEKLCRETVIHEQRLIAPMPLELSPSEETCVLDHMDIFEKNGFRFSYDPEKPVRHRLSLTGLPHSGARDGRKAVQFGKDDVAALCDILGASDEHETSSASLGGGTGVDGSGVFGNNAVKRHAVRSLSSAHGDDADKIIARLPKAIAMFASRACRGSIMIGRALSETEMDRIVKRLADVEHPWNCPHGRPTMRHVADLKYAFENDEKAAAEHVAGPTVTILSQDEQGV